MWGSDVRMRTFRPVRRQGDAVVPPRLWSYSRFSDLKVYYCACIKRPRGAYYPWSGSQEWKFRMESSHAEERHAQIILRVVRMRLVGAAAPARFTTGPELEGKRNCFMGWCSAWWIARASPLADFSGSRTSTISICRSNWWYSVPARRPWGRN